MKNIYKGFTLVELLIVIVIIGILSSMMLIAGTEAQTAAQVTKITEGFRSLTGALMMVYNEDTASADKADATKLIAAAKKYVKKDAVFGASATIKGTYYVTIDGSNWWLSYYLPGAKGDVNTLLQKKADDFGLKASASATKDGANNQYAGAQIVYYQAR